MDLVQPPPPQLQPPQPLPPPPHMQQLLLSVEHLSGVLRQSHGELLEVCSALCTPTPSVESQGHHAACLGRAVKLLDAQSELSRAVLAVLAQRENLVVGGAPSFTPSSHPRQGSVDQLLVCNNGSGRRQRPTPPIATSTIDANGWVRVDAVVKPPGAPPAECVAAAVMTDMSQAPAHSSPFGSRKWSLSGRRRARPSSESQSGADGSFSSSSASSASGSPWLAPAADAATAAPRLATIASCSCGEASIPFGEVPQPRRPPSAAVSFAAVLAELRMGPLHESSPLPPSALRAGHSRPYTERGGRARSSLAQHVSRSAPGSASASRESSPHMGASSSLRRLSPSIFRRSSLLQRYEVSMEAEGGGQALRRSSEPEPSLQPLDRDSLSNARRRRRQTASSLRASLRASRPSGMEVAASVPHKELEVGGAEAEREEREPAGTKRRESRRKPSSSSTAAAAASAAAKGGVGGGLTEEVPFPAEGEEATVAVQLQSALGANHTTVPQATPHPRTLAPSHPRTLAPSRPCPRALAGCAGACGALDAVPEPPQGGVVGR